MNTVLLVADRRSVADPIAAALEEAHFQVMGCPGPRAPSYRCIGGAGGDCPLAKAADVVVIDCDLASDAAMEGTPSWLLAAYYMGRGIPVLALMDDLSHQELSGGIVGLPATSPPWMVVATVRRLQRVTAA